MPSILQSINRRAASSAFRFGERPRSGATISGSSPRIDTAAYSNSKARSPRTMLTGILPTKAQVATTQPVGSACRPTAALPRSVPRTSQWKSGDVLGRAFFARGRDARRAGVAGRGMGRSRQGRGGILLVALLFGEERATGRAFDAAQLLHEIRGGVSGIDHVHVAFARHRGDCRGPDLVSGPGGRRRDSHFQGNDHTGLHNRTVCRRLVAIAGGQKFAGRGFLPTAVRLRHV